jgi:prepilin-type N-terminal cleavage/methylation domain-containing protein
MNHRTRAAGRAGFTLIELLIVITIILVLGGLALLFVPSALDAQRAAQGGTRVQQWLMIARQRALLDRAPRGVRLLPDPNNPALISGVQYIEQPDDFFGGEVMQKVVGGVPQLDRLVFQNVDLTGGFAPDLTRYPVQPGDYIELRGTGLVHRIDPDPKNTPVQPNELKLLSPLPVEITTWTPQYRIIRAPRVQGEEPETMPVNVAIDLAVSRNLPPANSDGNIDILFSPAGAVLGPVGTDKIILWIRDYTLPTPFEGEPTLIAVYTRSGLIAAYPVDMPPAADPYSFVK